MMFANAGSVFNTLAADALWLLIIGAVVFFSFIGLLHKWDIDRMQRDSEREARRKQTRRKNGK